MSTYDTTTDGLSIDTTPEEDRGLVQGLMVGGRALSAVVTAALMGLFSEKGQWSFIFYMIAVIGLIALVMAVFVKDTAERSSETRYSKDAFKSFKNKAFLLFLVLGIIYPLALYSTQGMVSAFLNEGLGISLGTVGLYTSVFGIGTILGGVIGGPLMKKVGERASVLTALIGTAVVTFVLAVTPSAGLMWAVVFLFGFAFGYYETVYFAMGMDFSDPRIAAFMFSIIMAVGNIGIGLGQPLAGALVDGVGFRPCSPSSGRCTCWRSVVFAISNFTRTRKRRKCRSNPLRSNPLTGTTNRSYRGLRQLPGAQLRADQGA